MRFDPVVELLIKLQGDEHWWSLGEFLSVKTATEHLLRLMNEAAARGQDLKIVSYMCWPATQVWNQPDLPW